MATPSSAALKQALARLVDARQHAAERFLSQVDFAEGLAKLHPAKAKAWGRLLDEACGIVAKALAGGRLDGLDAAVARAEGVLAPIAQTAKTYTMHCVGHAHIDMNWMWSWPETVACTNDTFTTMLALMDEFPDFCFTQSQASVYEIVRRHRPDMLQRIAARVREGRWEVAAVHWVEGDKNIAGGESLARHLLYTRRLLAETFGLAPEDAPLDWEPDTFGHAHTIPTIISRGGVRRYYMCRGGAFPKPPVFWWQGPDGRRVLVNLETTWYNDNIGPHNAKAMLAFCEKTGIRDWMNVYGVGDHGGGPTRRDILRAHDMDTWPVYPNVRLATTSAYYAILEEQGDRWPVLDRELNYEFTGCYTSQAFIKQANRLGENYCVEAETVAAVALRAAGREYPQDALREAWTRCLFGHFHDILPGSGVRATRDYQLGLFQELAAATGIIRTESLRALARAADTSFAAADAGPQPVPEQASIALGGGSGRGTDLGGITVAGHVTAGPRPLVVFNPTAWARAEVVRATVWDTEAAPPAPNAPRTPWRVRTPDGATVAAQRLADGDYWGHRYVDLALPASVGGLGYAACAVEEGEAPPPAGAVTCGGEHEWARAGLQTPLEMDSDRVAVALDRRTGGIVRLVDKATGRDLASAEHPMGVLEFINERPHGGTAWVIGDFQSVRTPLELDSLAFAHKGPVVGSIVAKLRISRSEITITYSLKAGQPWVDVEVQAHWLEVGTKETGVPMLRMAFPMALEQARGRYEIPFGSIQRDEPAGQEVPALRWADVTGKAAGGGKAGARQAGCALLNDCKYGHSLDSSTLRLTLIRSTYDPDTLPEIGDHAIRMALLPHGKPLAAADLVRLGAAFNHPLAVVATDAHAGGLPAAAEGVCVTPAGVVLSSVRKAQDDDALIFHLFETAGRDATARVTLDARVFGTVTAAEEVDFLERPVEKPTAKRLPRGFTVDIPASGIAAVKVTLG